VFSIQLSYLKLENSKLSDTSSFGNNLVHSILGKIFRIITETVDMGCVNVLNLHIIDLAKKLYTDL
jgi:hypothetical protein